jgi:DNA-binding NarL/FixJ family response regulator
MQCSRDALRLLVREESEPGEVKMRILIADDHWVVRESLKLVMKKLRQRFEPLEAATFEEAITILRAHPDVDLMLIDLIMPGFEEFAGLQRLRETFPEVPVVVISVHEDADYVLRSISFGVVGYIPKSAGGAEIERALNGCSPGKCPTREPFLNALRMASRAFL